MLMSKKSNSCISLIQGFSDKEKLVKGTGTIVTEEWGHFRLVCKNWTKEVLKLGPQRKDNYVNDIVRLPDKGGSCDDRLTEQTALAMALIEARSCERFKRLSEGLKDNYLAKFYRRFMESEAAITPCFWNSQKNILSKDKVRKRWHEWLAHEEVIMKEMELRGDRIH